MAQDYVVGQEYHSQTLSLSSVPAVVKLVEVNPKNSFGYNCVVSLGGMRILGNVKDLIQKAAN